MPASNVSPDLLDEEMSTAEAYRAGQLLSEWALSPKAHPTYRAFMRGVALPAARDVNAKLINHLLKWRFICSILFATTVIFVYLWSTKP